MARPAHLIGPGPGGDAHRWPLAQEAFTIGRHPPADLVLPHPRISRLHARIQHTPQGYFIEDLDSRNGTFVNGEPVARQPKRLWGGDEIVVGGAASFRFDDPDETATGPRIGRLKGVWIDSQSRSVWVDAHPVQPPLSQAQFLLLEHLYKNEAQLITREEIIAIAWPDADPSGISADAVNGIIKRLRKRLRETQTNENEYIEVRRGHGIRLLH